MLKEDFFYIWEVLKRSPVFQWHQWTAEQCQGKLNWAQDKSFQAPVGLDPAWQYLTIGFNAKFFKRMPSNTKARWNLGFHIIKFQPERKTTTDLNVFKWTFVYYFTPRLMSIFACSSELETNLCSVRVTSNDKKVSKYFLSRSDVAYSAFDFECRNTWI